MRVRHFGIVHGWVLKQTEWETLDAIATDWYECMQANSQSGRQAHDEQANDESAQWNDNNNNNNFRGRLYRGECTELNTT